MEVIGAMEEGSKTILKKSSCFQVTDGVPILTFDPSVENFLSIMEVISEICGRTKEESFEASEIERFNSMIVFVREWKQFYFCEWMPFHYKSKTVNFTYQTESAEAKTVINGIKLPHFSSAAIPKVEKLPNTASAFENDDFVLHVGGSIWALDWCPRLHENFGCDQCDVKCEYLAIAAHPTGSEYHKIGEQFSGRGFIQIWCFLHLDDKEELLNPGGVRLRGQDSKKVNEDSCVPKRRGRPRKAASSAPNETNGGRAMKSCSTNRKREVEDGFTIICYDNDQAVKTKGLSPIREDNELEHGVLPCQVGDCREIVTVTENTIQYQSFIHEGIALPRLVFSLAHNGKVAWDMKWRPFDAADSKAKHHLGYLAVLLGDGSLEVWEVPVHNLVKLLYAGCQAEGTDPRFLKLQPVFRCSRLKFGERQSIPLALEWSPSASRDLILAGCHDGTVALWKFCSQLSSKDTKPLLCFTADTVPIRSLAWAPDDSDVECSNLIVTAGHEGLKFWDLRCPYRPLLDLCPVQRAVLSFDWLKDPRCLVIAYEDGIMRTLSLTKIANDMPVTGEPLTKATQRGLHSQFCSVFAIWSVQVSRRTGLVAYCSSDGCTRYFQLTTAAVEKDSSRHRQPHFLCGSLGEEAPALSINTPLKGVRLPKISLVSKAATNVARPKNSSVPALCWHDDDATNNSEVPVGKRREDESKQNFARFPPKIVAMHKVRWNMNKGSGRWLCCGGAAGIVRCQVISPK